MTIVPRLLQSLGVHPTDVLAAAGLTADALDDPEGAIPYAAMGKLVETGADRTGCTHFGLLIGQQITIATMGLVGELMREAPTLAVALQDFVNHQHRHANGGVAYLLRHGECAFFGYAVYQPGMVGNSLIYEGAAAAAFNLVAGLRRPAELTGMAIMISRAEPSNPEPYRRFFGVLPQFNAGQTGVLFPRSWLQQPMIGTDAERHRALEERVRARSWVGDADIVAQVRRALQIGLVSGRIAGEEIAADLRLARRTLHRRLTDRGVRFQLLLDDVRYELAQQLLVNTQLGIGEIGLILRYADPSMFTRAFVRWAGVNPKVWRSEAHGEPTLVGDLSSSV